MKIHKHLFRLAAQRLLQLTLLGLLLVNPALAAEVAAYTQFVVGNVSATSEDGVERILGRGDLIYSGDNIVSGPEGSAQLLFMDNSRMAVRVNTRFRINHYHYDANQRDNSRSSFLLIRGAIRSITGLIGNYNKRNVSYKTPVATIGVRGTDHEIIHITETFNNGRSANLTGSYNKVYAGATYLKSNKGTLNLDKNEVGFVAGTTPENADEPIRLDSLPEIIEQTLVRYIPVQSNATPTSPVEPVVSTVSTLLSSSSNLVNELAARLEPTTSTLINTIDSTLDGVSSSTLEPAINTLTSTTSSLTQDLSSSGILSTTSSIADSLVVPLTSEPLVVPEIPIIPTLPGL